MGGRGRGSGPLRAVPWPGSGPPRLRLAEVRTWLLVPLVNADAAARLLRPSRAGSWALLPGGCTAGAGGSIGGLRAAGTGTGPRGPGARTGYGPGARTGPRRAGVGAWRAGAKSRGAGVGPQWAGARPRRAWVGPQWAGARPRRAGARPRRAGARPRRAGARPRRAGARPRRAGARPRRAGVRPGLARTDSGPLLPSHARRHTGLLPLCVSAGPARTDSGSRWLTSVHVGTGPGPVRTRGARTRPHTARLLRPDRAGAGPGPPRPRVSRPRRHRGCRPPRPRVSRPRRHRGCRPPWHRVSRPPWHRAAALDSGGARPTRAGPGRHRGGAGPACYGAGTRPTGSSPALTRPDARPTRPTPALTHADARPSLARHDGGVSSARHDRGAGSARPYASGLAPPAGASRLRVPRPPRGGPGPRGLLLFPGPVRHPLRHRPPCVEASACGGRGGGLVGVGAPDAACRQGGGQDGRSREAVGARPVPGPAGSPTRRHADGAGAGTRPLRRPRPHPPRPRR